MTPQKMHPAFTAMLDDSAAALLAKTPAALAKECLLRLVTVPHAISVLSGLPDMHRRTEHTPSPPHLMPTWVAYQLRMAKLTAQKGTWKAKGRNHDSTGAYDVVVEYDFSKSTTDRRITDNPGGCGTVDGAIKITMDSTVAWEGRVKGSWKATTAWLGRSVGEVLTFDMDAKVTPEFSPAIPAVDGNAALEHSAVEYLAKSWAFGTVSKYTVKSKTADVFTVEADCKNILKLKLFEGETAVIEIAKTGDVTLKFLNTTRVVQKKVFRAPVLSESMARYVSAM